MFHKSQVLFYLLTSFVLGIFIGSFWAISNTGILALILIGTATLGIFGYHKNFNLFGLLIGCLIIVFALGIFRFSKYDLDRRQVMEFADNIIGGKGVEYTLRGYVASDPENRGGITKFVLRTKKIAAPNREIFINDDILITANLSDVKYGEKLSVAGSLVTPINFDDFDYISYLKKDGIRVLVNYPKEVGTDPNLNLSKLDKLKIFLYRPIFNLKNKFEQAVNKTVSEPNAAFINGILLGTRQGISSDLKNAFNKTGMSHILAISGYNIAIIAWAILEMLVFFIKRKKAFWASVLIIGIFTIMTGASASVVRASVMGLILLFASGYGRLYDPKNSILFAGALMIFQNPFVLRFDIGFQLSFMAVLGLIYLYPIMGHWFRKIPNPLKLKELILATLSAQIFVSLLLIYHFKNFSLVSLPANILILPFLPITMLLGFLTGLGGMITPVLGQLIGYTAWAVSKYQIGVIENLASLSRSSMSISISLPALLIIYGLLFLGLRHVYINKISKLP